MGPLIVGRTYKYASGAKVREDLDRLAKMDDLRDKKVVELEGEVDKLRKERDAKFSIEEVEEAKDKTHKDERTKFFDIMEMDNTFYIFNEHLLKSKEEKEG